MPKYAMHNDPKVRKKKYDAQKVSGTGHNEGGMGSEQREREMKLGQADINSVFNRDDNAGNAESQTGISIFDPVLCEIAYRWFSAPNSFVLDPFAGGSVRGIVAAELGRNYIGIDLRAEQIEANRNQAKTICKTMQPTWHVGNSKNVSALLGEHQVDFVFSCPPYFDLEVYSDNPEDLSSMSHKKFIEEYNDIIKNCCHHLRDNRFACFVVGDVRDKKGNYLNFVSLTIQAFLDAGLHLYNEAILLTAIGSLPIRAGRVFSASRKLGKTHQNVLVFVKGDAKLATSFCGPVEVPEMMENAETDEPNTFKGMET